MLQLQSMPGLKEQRVSVKRRQEWQLIRLLATDSQLVDLLAGK